MEMELARKVRQHIEEYEVGVRGGGEVGACGGRSRQKRYELGVRNFSVWEENVAEDGAGVGTDGEGAQRGIQGGSRGNRGGKGKSRGWSGSESIEQGDT
eukprot:1155998-Pelagomonas_calceolata.AAC.8